MQSIRIYVVCLLALVAGCAVMEALQPQNFDQKYAAANALNDRINTSTARGIDAEKLSSATGKHVMGVTDKVAGGVDLAKATADAGDIETAEGQLRLTENLLDEIERYLLSQGVKVDGDE